MIREPAIGQDSMRLASRRASVGFLSEVILISGDFLNLALAERDQLWLVGGILSTRFGVVVGLSSRSWGD
jgi:hypothetical protein